MFQVSSFDPRTLIWWYNQKEEIDFSPSYQRKGDRWSITDQAYLIDSIINGFDIPKIYLTDFTFYNTVLNTAQKPYAVIDGKQRLGAIFKFIENELPLNRNIVYYKDRDIDLGGYTYSRIKQHFPKVAIEFDNFNLSVMRVITDEPRMIEELFLRLNKNQKLSGAETRNAIGGPVVDAIRQVAAHKFFSDTIVFSKKRGEDLNLAAKLIYLETIGKFVDLKKVNLDRFTERWFDYDFDFERIAGTMFDTLEKMYSIFSPVQQLTRAQGEIPIYYWFVKECTANIDTIQEFFILFDEYRKKSDMQNISDPLTHGVMQEEFLNYNILRRSTNDQNSLSGRYRIMCDAFEVFYKLVP